MGEGHSWLITPRKGTWQAALHKFATQSAAISPEPFLRAELRVWNKEREGTRRNKRERKGKERERGGGENFEKRVEGKDNKKREWYMPYSGMNCGVGLWPKEFMNIANHVD